MKKLLYILILYVIPVFISAQIPSDSTHNAIKIGKAKLVVDVLCFADSVDTQTYGTMSLDEIFAPLEIYGISAPIYDYDQNVILTPLKRDSTTYSAEIPVERLEEIGGFQVLIDGNWAFGSPVLLRQDDPTVVGLDIFLSAPDRRYIRYYGAGKQYSMEDWGSISGTAINAVSTNPFLYIPKDRNLYNKSWKAVREYQVGTAFPRFMQESIGDKIIPQHAKKWMMNDLKRYFASQCILLYTYRANMVNIKPKEPPVESYSFLDSIDYTPDVFLLNYHILSMRYFLSNFLKCIDGGLEDIGERTVKEWKEYMDRKLAPAMRERPKLLLDLLAGMSYVWQIDQKKPLTPIQIENINEGFTDDIGKIVLARNEALVARLEKKEKAELRNMTDEAFELKKFIDENYKGRPVVVDLWNTWCSPCLEAISQSEETKQEFAGSDLVFLYVADDSSPEDEWSRKAEEIGSKQVRVSTDTSAAILKSHNLEGFPSYLFFDRDHNLVHSRTAFPGTRRFRELLLELNPRK